MKHAMFAAAILGASLVMPAFAEDKPAVDAPKAQAKAKKSKTHSHMEDRQGIKPSDQAPAKSEPADKSKHSHPRDR